MTLSENKIFNNKTVVITGASAGVGAACARAFAESGANLVLLARGQDALDKISQELSALTKVVTIVADVGVLDDCYSVLERAEAEFGGINVLINNAGLHIRGNVESNKPADYAAMVDVNLRAPIAMTSAALPYIRRSGGGAVVMISSLAGLSPLQGAATYSATKAGLTTFAYALADELRGSNINIGVVSPGPVDTGFIMNELDKVEDIVFSQPISTGAEVANSVLRLASGEKKVEIAMPWWSGKLATLAYLFPSLRRLVRPMLYKKGRANKEKYRQRN